jgi:hypothetical protein
MMTTDTSPSVFPSFFFSADDNASIWRESWRISSSKSARADVIARERDNHCLTDGIDGVHIFDEHVLPSVGFANGLSGALRVDLLDAGSNRADHIE